MSGYVLTEQAERGLNDIWDYIAADDVDQEDAVLAEIREALNLIAAAPGVGHKRADVKSPRYRFWRANRFIIAYFHETRPVQVIRIIGAQRDFRRIRFR
jgi:plasmid stabilization system protein ParE